MNKTVTFGREEYSSPVMSSLELECSEWICEASAGFAATNEGFDVDGSVYEW